MRQTKWETRGFGAGVWNRQKDKERKEILQRRITSIKGADPSLHTADRCKSPIHFPLTHIYLRVRVCVYVLSERHEMDLRTAQKYCIYTHTHTHTTRSVFQEEIRERPKESKKPAWEPGHLTCEGREWERLDFYFFILRDGSRKSLSDYWAYVAVDPRPAVSPSRISKLTASPRSAHSKPETLVLSPWGESPIEIQQATTTTDGHKEKRERRERERKRRRWEKKKNLAQQKLAIQ